MSFDGIVTKAMTKELNEELVRGKISKIYQPNKYDLIVHIRVHGKKKQLILSAHPTYSRIHLTNETYGNPEQPPMFCMMMRKHIEGGIIDKVHQIETERIIIIDIRSRNEIGDESKKQLIIEIMGRHSNIVLVESEKEKIIESIKHITPAVSRERSVMPGLSYERPPSQHKVNPFEANEEVFLKKMDFNAGKVDMQIVQNFAGISPLFAKEAVFLAGLANRTNLLQHFFNLIEKVRHDEIAPQIIQTETKELFYVLPLTHLQGESRTFPTISAMLDRFYYGKADRDRIKQQANDLEKFIRNEKKKNEKKIIKLERTLEDSKKADIYQLRGELLTANMHLISRGDKEVEVINYYDEQGSTVTIPLDVQKTPSENAQSYFQKYNKLKNSVSVVIEQIEKAKQETTYFDTIIQQVESASWKDIEEIREELIEEGYLKRRSQNKKQKKKKNIELEQYISSDGTDIYVGKNNKQNEFLTNRYANRTDTWLHTKDIPGSHVVIRAEDPSETTLHEAANIAAYFSKAKQSSSVPVDITLVKHVKKPSGAKPGFVIYDNQKTIFVTPDEDLILKLKK
ncbi:Rqc2 family fibronectin-binding protein [Bacillus solimangrovi]|uniref:Rqc2 homolog RqcH n=1 Tax=Bacillus solimangrovi TaxID=1305675 RepID=A0A1E5LAT3_9BACI|nr:NFACT RNA binding domain-containing protein [Bacillus solimangrovi]OEH91205.1 hypothetical protein BFG57_06195 [Bacillus solimangrovi]